MAALHLWAPTSSCHKNWNYSDDVLLRLLLLSVCVSVSEFSEVLPPFFPPPTFSSVRVGGVVVVVGGCGGTVSGTQASTPSSPLFPFLWMLWMNEKVVG